MNKSYHLVVLLLGETIFGKWRKSKLNPAKVETGETPAKRRNSGETPSKAKTLGES